MADMYDIQNPSEQYYSSSFKPPNPANRKKRRIIAIIITVLVITGLTAGYLRITRTERIYSEKQLQKEYYKYKEDIDEIIAITKNVMSDEDRSFIVDYDGYEKDSEIVFWIDISSTSKRKDVSDEMSEEEKELITTFIDQSKFGSIRLEKDSLVLSRDAGGMMDSNGVVIATDGGDPYVGPGAEFTEFDENAYYFRW